jgi:hypothetical protein
MFKESVQILSRFPLLGRQVEGRDIRVFVKEHYQIFYLDQKDAIEILHFWDSRRNPEDLNL